MEADLAFGSLRLEIRGNIVDCESHGHSSCELMRGREVIVATARSLRAPTTSIPREQNRTRPECRLGLIDIFERTYAQWIRRRERPCSKRQTDGGRRAETPIS